MRSKKHMQYQLQFLFLLLKLPVRISRSVLRFLRFVKAEISGDQIIIKDKVDVIDYYIKFIQERQKGCTVKLLTPKKMMEYKLVFYNKPSGIVFGYWENNSDEFLFTIEVTGKNEKAVYNCCANAKYFVSPGGDSGAYYYSLRTYIVFSGPFLTSGVQNNVEIRKVKSEGGRIELICPSKAKINSEDSSKTK